MLYGLARSALFVLPPEVSHDLSLSSIDALGLLPQGSVFSTVHAPKTVMGIEFPNSVGLAAGLDKNADHILGLSQVGFGFIEVGTVTPKPQDGNPKPRLFRLPKQQAIINRMGFNNKGVDYLVRRVISARSKGFKGVIGINIGKNLTTAVEHAADDYLACLNKVFIHADYITVNVSSPNTPGLRSLQFGEALSELLACLKHRHSELVSEHGKVVPLVLKIAPDLSDAEIALLAEQFLDSEIDGIIIGNTTSGRVGVEGAAAASEAGGLSGRPLFHLSTDVVRKFNVILQGRIPIIAVGGISSADDAEAKIDAGASLVQVYTGFVYQGPSMIHAAAKRLALRP